MMRERNNPDPLFDSSSPFAVPCFVHACGGLVERYRRFWIHLGRLESQVFADELASLRIDCPVHVCGLARSGSTLLHEFLAAQPGSATLRMRDYPFVFTPVWWRQATANLKPGVPRERAHGDSILVTTESPDAIEEMLWMAFFPKCHDPSVSHRLSASDRHAEFEAFYRSHLRKVLFSERAARYVAKNNYHVARLSYLVRLFPDARFLIPIREPIGHVASLMRQQWLFSEGHRRFPRSLAVMRRTGHFEFGRMRRPINLGDTDCVSRIKSHWSRGQEVRGWALYWNMIYRYLAASLAADEAVRRASLVVRYESLCTEPGETLRQVLKHCQMPVDDSAVEGFAGSVSRPTYYERGLSADDEGTIRELTAAARASWGY